MNLEGQSQFSQARIEWAIRLRYSPMPELDMGYLASLLNAFRIGELRVVGKVWEVMMERDGELAVNADKRCSDACGLEWQVVSDGSTEGDAHAAALDYFYRHLKATEALDQDDTGRCDHLIYQVLSAHSYRYSVHEILLRVDNPAAREVTAEFRHTPVWFFESRRGYLGYLKHIFDMYGQPCVEGEWLTAVGMGWMRPLSIAFAMKHFPLRDWLLFCSRYGSGFLEGITDAQKDSPEWEEAAEALRAIANDGVALHNRGVTFQFLEQSARASLPFEAIVEMVNGLYARCYRGVASAREPAGLGAGNSEGLLGQGVRMAQSLNAVERGILLARDARWVTGLFNERIDRPVIRYLFGREPRAGFVLLPPLDEASAQDLAGLQALVPMGLRVALADVYRRFGWKPPKAGEPVLGVRSADPPPLRYGAARAGGRGDGEPGANGGQGAKSERTDQTDPAERAEDRPIAPGADAGRAVQTADASMPDPQVDAAGFWSRAGLMPALPGRDRAVRRAGPGGSPGTASPTSPRGADGQTLPMPSLGYALPNGAEAQGKESRE